MSLVWDSVTKLDSTQSATVDLLAVFSNQSDAKNKEKTRETTVKSEDPSITTTTTKDQDNEIEQKELASTADFLSWFSRVEKDIEFEHEQRYWAHLASIAKRLDECEDLIATTKEAEDLVKKEKEYFSFVESRTEALKRECESLLKEQQSLELLSQDLQDRLIKFNVLEPAVRLFNGTGVDGVVLDIEFVPMLARLDDSLTFVDAHKKYKDADLYRMKFRQCITRGLTLIKMYFVNTMRLLGDEINRQLHDILQQSSTTPNQSLQTALLYAKFKTAADSGGLRALIGEIEARIPGHPEYNGLLGECLNAYFSVREGLVKGGVEKVVDSLLVESTDVLQVAKNGAAYIMSLSADECGLFNQFFVKGDHELVQYLDKLSVSLYDHLRPRIVREQRIDVLADLCRSLYLHLESVESLTSATTGTNPDPKIAEGSGAPVKYVVGKILEDAQERLAFRAADYIRQEIEMFSPKDRELDVLARSKKLPIPSAMMVQANMVPDLVPEIPPDGEGDQAESSTENAIPPTSVIPSATATIAVAPPNDPSPTGSDIKSPALPTRTSSTSSLMSGSQEEQVARTINAGKLVYGSGEWYPTLHKALYILGKLYRAVPKPIFEDLAQEAIDLCRKSMISASEIIATKNTRLDGQFFLIKNLLMLREQIAPFDSTFVRKEDVIDFSKITDALAAVFQSKWGISTLPTLGLTFLTTQLPSLMIPTLIQQVSKDSKISVNLSLKQTCEEMILDTVKVCVEPVSSFMIKVTAFRLKSVKAG
ncbi:UNVERIFIED_CONTAM: Golgi transport complex subunit 3, partial [Siphonaria sp. JEL0065]